jgi:hypothetical protein
MMSTQTNRQKGGNVTPEDNVNWLASAALGSAYRGARAYLQRNVLGVVSEDALCACVKSHVKAALEGAWNDAKAALDAGMTEIAVETFAASMVLAGIEAAKEASIFRPVGKAVSR